ncbi:MAG TPA: lipoyl(octanoyl) transferase LipB [Candidatus Rubrimentiphilum sp.]|nr:lipoyl(octanoyl) transferase LipB [Candidatus Rubrimentiphilum sp.]
MTARVLELGLRPYREVYDLQRELHERVRTGRDPETWIFVEHPPVITLGRNAKTANILLSREVLAQRGVDVVETERGGDVTYHGPGQLVVYTIRRLERFREIVPLVRALEGAVIEACAGFGVHGERFADHAGVWVGNNQLCAIGLSVRKMTSMHGIALNVSNELSYDQLINPCGLTDRGLTSLSRETGRAISMDDAKSALLGAFAREFDLECVTSSAAPVAPRSVVLRQAQDDNVIATTRVVA